MIIAFDADVLIYAAQAGHVIGEEVKGFIQANLKGRLTGSILLLPELLTKPIREGWQEQKKDLLILLSYLELISPDEQTAYLAVSLGAAYKLKPMDAMHLATAVSVGADVFLTNNTKDFSGKSISEIQIQHPITAEI